MSLDFPKVLVVSINAWRDNTGINTLIELFKEWDKDRLAQIYTRSALPKTKICDRFFQIAENKVMRSTIKRKTITGKVVNNETNIAEADMKAVGGEEKLYKKARSKNSWLLAISREVVWKLGKWKTKEFDGFLDSFNPDVLFLPIYPTVYMNVLQNYIIKKTKKPAVCFIGDDNYTYKTGGVNPLFYIHRFFLRKAVRKVVKACSKMFVIAPKQKEEYDRIFGVDSIVLTKGIDYSGIEYKKKPVSQPIKMVYTGKLIIGRWKSLASIAEALGNINKDSLRITLDIYTADEVKPSILKKLNINGSKIRGAVPLKEVAGIQADSDIVVFVESLDWRYRNAARLSFSTKLTDYLKSGKCIFAVGDKDIAPIDYLVKNECAVIATNYIDIEKKLTMLTENPDIIGDYGLKAFECGKKNHNQVDIFNKLKDTIREVCIDE